MKEGGREEVRGMLRLKPSAALTFLIKTVSYVTPSASQWLKGDLHPALQPQHQQQHLQLPAFQQHL